MGDWTLFSNHGHVLLYLAGDTRARLRDVAENVGITERAVQKIVRELQDAGYLTVTKHGRCNRYRINGRKSLRHPIESHCTLSRLIQAVVRTGPGDAGAAESADEPAAASPAPKPARSAPRSRPESRSTASSSAPSESRKVSAEGQSASPAPEAAKPPASRPSAEAPGAPERKEAPAKRRPGRARKESEESPPADTREQGSLF